MLTVKQLIDTLKTYNPELGVALLHNYGSHDAKLTHINQVSTAKVSKDGVDNLYITIVDENTKVEVKPEPTPEASQIPVSL